VSNTKTYFKFYEIQQVFSRVNRHSKTHLSFTTKEQDNSFMVFNILEQQCLQSIIKRDSKLIASEQQYPY